MTAPVSDLIALLKQDAAPVFQGSKEVVVARAPARLDVMGGITDTAGGLVVALPLEAAAAVAVQRRDDRKLIIKTYNTQASGSDTHARVELSLDDFYGSASLLPDAMLRDLFTAGGGGKRWAAYIAGAFPMLAKHKKFTRRTHGANIACFSNVPFGVGLGSSAAVACAALTALMEAFHLILDPMEIATLAQKLEHQIVGSPRGMMDQATAVLGKPGQLLLLECQPHTVKGFIPVPAGYFFAAINSGIAPLIGSEAYRRARISAAMAQAIIARMYQDFGQKKDPTNGYLANVPPVMNAWYFHAALPETITGKHFQERYGAVLERVATIQPGETYRPRAAAEHHLGERKRTQDFLKLIGKLETPAAAMAAGALMRASHRSCSEHLGLGHEATDRLVRLIEARGANQGLFGARIMGVGGGGSVAVLAADREDARKALEEVCAEYSRETGTTAQLLTGSSAGSAESAVLRGKLPELLK